MHVIQKKVSHLPRLWKIVELNCYQGQPVPIKRMLGEMGIWIERKISRVTSGFVGMNKNDKLGYTLKLTPSYDS